MPTPSKAELWDQYTKAAKITDQIYKFGATNGTNYLDLEDAVFQALEGDHTTKVTASLDAHRKALSSLVSAGQNLLSPILINIAKIGYSLNVTGMTISQVIEEIRKAMDSASETVRHRDITFGSVSAGGSNVSTGNIYRTEIDEYNEKIEAGFVGVTKIDTIEDKNSGRRSGAEQLRIYGSGAGQFVDELDIGTATRATANILMRRSEDGLLKNSTFSNFDTKDGNPTVVEQPGWTVGDKTLVTRITESNANPDIFRFDRGRETGTTLGTDLTGSSLRFDGDTSVSQYVAREKFRFRKDRPYFLIVPWMRKSSATGTLTIRLGSQTASATIGSATNDVWNYLTIGPGENKGWFSVFNEDWTDLGVTPNRDLGVRVKIEVSSLATSTVIVANVLLDAAIPFNGCFYLAQAGATDTLVDDTWSFTDSANETGRTQYVTHRMFRKYFPHTNTGETYADA